MTMLSSSSEPWRPKQRQSIITALTMLPGGWDSAQRSTAITSMWLESFGNKRQLPLCHNGNWLDVRSSKRDMERLLID